MGKLKDYLDTTKLIVSVSRELITDLIKSIADRRYNLPEPRPRCIFCKEELKISFITKGSYSCECVYCLSGTASCYSMIAYSDIVYLENLTTDRYKINLYDNYTYIYSLKENIELFRLDYQLYVDHKTKYEIDEDIDRLVRLKNFF